MTIWPSPIRKSGLFKQVTLIRAEDVAENDFQGASYKMWVLSGGWTLAKQGGGREKLASTPIFGDPKAANFTVFLTNLQHAATTADGG